MARESLWIATSSDTEARPSLADTVRVDVAVLGAGIFGVTTAYLLKQAGLRVALVELGRVGGGTTGHTTAKLTVGHSLVYADLTSRYGVEGARLYARSNQQAIEQMEAIAEAESIDCDWERATNFVYTEDRHRGVELEREVAAARQAGIDAALTAETDLPYPVHGAVKVEGQAQFHPRRYLLALADCVEGDGSSVHEQTRAIGVSGRRRRVVEVAGGGRIECGHVVVATHMPFLDRGLLFAKARPEKSYVVAAPMPENEAPRGMYISIDKPTRSVRSTPRGEGERWLIVGGESHTPGEDPDTEKRYAALRAFARDRFGVESAYEWSAHDYMPLDRLPYVGQVLPGDAQLLTATGFAKWGLTKATIAAQIVVDLILGRENPSASFYDARRLNLRQSARPFLEANAHVAWRFVGDRLRSEPAEAVGGLAPGEGMVVRVGTRHDAVSRDRDGVLHTVSARCTHLGCLVGWNRADEVWECPCHGSVFAADGRLIEGPATRDLPRRAV